MPVRVEDVPEIGRKFDLEANEAEREALARVASIDGLPSLRASFDVTRHGESLHVTGTVRGRVRQTCVVTLEPVESDIQEAVDLTFVPPQTEVPFDEAANLSDPPELLENGAVDLGAIATEFLILGIDHYPRKPGVEFALPAESDRPASPFAALGNLLKGKKE